MQPAHGTSTGDAVGASYTPSLAAPRDDGALDDVRREFGDRWEIARINGGCKATIRDTGGRTPIPRYGRTPVELAESIRMMEGQP
jgi:hypothetical protein